MKKIDLRNWGNKDDLKGLLLFVQLMEEMLFHFNTHSNKVHATNVRTLAFEAKHIINKIELEKIKNSNILPVLAEN